jgi:hypothetical protein
VVGVGVIDGLAVGPAVGVLTGGSTTVCVFGKSAKEATNKTAIMATTITESIFFPTWRFPEDFSGEDNLRVCLNLLVSKPKPSIIVCLYLAIIISQ